MTLKFYFDHMSQPCRAVGMFLKANSIRFEPMPVALRKGEQKSAQFEAINPFNKVPALDHNGIKMNESVAMLRYLCRTFKVADNWYPQDSVKQLRVDEHLAWQHLNTRYYGMTFFQQKINIPFVTKNPVDEIQVAIARKGLETVLGKFETVWLKGQPYVAGDMISIADLLAVAELEQPSMGGFDIRSGQHPQFPLTQAYMERVRREMNPYYDEEHAIVYKVKEAYKGKV